MRIEIDYDLGPFGKGAEELIVPISLRENLAQFLPWLALGAMLLLPANRRPGAWLAALPALGFFLLTLLAQCAAGLFTGELLGWVIALQAVLFAAGMTWLLPWEDRRRGILRSLARTYATLSAGAVLCLVGMFGPKLVAREQAWFYALLVTPAFLLGFILTGIVSRPLRCKKRFLAWLLPASVLSGLAGVLPVGFLHKEMLFFEGVSLGLLYWLLLLPYVFIAFGSAFYRRRLQAAFRAEAREDGRVLPCGAECAETEAAKAQG